MEVKAGYKKTDAGIIPEDWNLLKFYDVFDFLATANNPRSDLSDTGEYRYIHYGDIHTNPSHILDCDKGNIPRIQKCKIQNLPFLKDGDLIMVDASEDFEGIGKSIEVKNVSDQLIVSGLHTLLLRGNKELIVDGYKSYLQYIKHIKQELIKIATGISVYGISKNNVKNILIPLPPLHEQKAIAEVLSNVDALIAAQEALIAKKRLIKQGVMQELLTGKRRLPGFSGEFEEHTLGEISSIMSGINKSLNSIGRGTLYVTVGDLYSGTSIAIDKMTRIEVTDAEVNRYALHSGDIIFGKSSVKREGIGYPNLFTGAKEPVVFSGFTFKARPIGDKVNPIFLLNQLRMESIRNWMINNAQASALTNINQSIANNIPLLIPPIKEQEAIAIILSDIDDEIIELEHQKNKYHLLKQGMRQELLTGRTRLT